MGTDQTDHGSRLGGERVTVGNVTFDSMIPCGNGHDFTQVGPAHVRFRARCGLAPYSWRFYFRIESPGDGRQITLEVADFNHFGQELWQEQATVYSVDDEQWSDLGTDNITLTGWTPTGRAEQDGSIDDGWHPPYGVRYRLKLDSPVMWLASPPPYTLAHSREHAEALAGRSTVFHVSEIDATHYACEHGYPMRVVKAAKAGTAEGKLRVVIVAGEHPAETAGMYACEGLMEEILRSSDLLSDLSFWIVPVFNVDGVAFGRTYHNVDPDDVCGPGVNLARDMRERTQPESRALWRLIEQVRPHCVVNLHNGRHRRQFEVYAPPQPHLSTLLRHFRRHLPLPVEHWRPYTDAGALSPEVLRAGLAEVALCFETLLLRKAPGCSTFIESYRRTGMFLLRGLVAGLREVYGKPQMLALREALHAGPVLCRADQFVSRLPAMYYRPSIGPDSFDDVVEGPLNFEVNGLPLEPGHYDAWLKLAPSASEVTVVNAQGKEHTTAGHDGWVLLPSRSIPARKLCFDFTPTQDELPFEAVLIAPEGMGWQAAGAAAEPYTRYKRDTRAQDKAHFGRWRQFHARLMEDGFGAAQLEEMLEQVVRWVAGRQVMQAEDHHFGAIWSEEDKYDARDAAAATACFAREYRQRADEQWLRRARAARAYVYRNQMHEPGNLTRDGGFVHMVHGIWGTNFTRLHPPYPGVDGVDTCVIIHQLCRAIELGLEPEEEDLQAIARAAQWVANNEPLPGVFLHHEGATHDCQNANALGLSALIRAYHALDSVGCEPLSEWLQAAERGLRHYLEGQEAIGVWPYWFAQVGRRAGAFHFDNIPDHGIGLYHLTRVCHLPPLGTEQADICWEGLPEALGRAARWYLGVACMDGDTIDLDYDRRPDLGDDICFSGFTWCRFTAAATLLRIARLTGETEPHRSLALRLMEHVRAKRWQTGAPSTAPVVAHARPDAKLATWCQAAEWNASMLAEMIDDLQKLESPAGQGA